MRQTRLEKFMTSLKIMLAMLIILIESICLTKSTNILINKRVNNTNIEDFLMFLNRKCNHHYARLGHALLP